MSVIPANRTATESVTNCGDRQDRFSIYGHRLTVDGFCACVLDYGLENFCELHFPFRRNWRFHRFWHRTSVANLSDDGLYSGAQRESLAIRLTASQASWVLEFDIIERKMLLMRVSSPVRFFVSLFALSVLSIPVALAQIVPDRLPGTWQSEDHKLVITGSEQKLTVHGFGKCHPDWCDWGKVPLSLIAPSIQSRDYTHALALWKNGSITTVAVVRAEQEDLSVEFFVVFHDNSGRSNYHHTALLKRTQ